jgi:hypothetical protein
MSNTQKVKRHFKRYSHTYLVLSAIVPSIYIGYRWGRTVEFEKAKEVVTHLEHALDYLGNQIQAEYGGSVEMIIREALTDS